MKDRKLNIAMLGHKRVPSREGGVEIVVEELAVRLVKAGHHVTCYNRKGNHIAGRKYNSFENIRNYRGIRLKPVLTISRKGFAAVSSSFFGAIGSALGKYDIVHFHAEGPCVMLWLPKLWAKKCIVTIHGLDWAREKWTGGIGAKYILWGEKIAVRLADEIIVLSEAIQKYFYETYGRETVYIPNGVTYPQNKKCKMIHQKYGLKKDSYFLYLSRLVPEKGITYLIEAFKHTRTEKKLVIAGGASDTDTFAAGLREMARDDERILFTGFVQGNELEELYSNAYVYILPSDLEGMPLTLLEAMSYGNCCLVSDIPECVEVVEDKAVIFSRGNVHELKECLQQLEDQPKVVWHYKAEASDFICNKYDWDRTMAETVELYTNKKHLEQLSGGIK